MQNRISFLTGFFYPFQVIGIGIYSFPVTLPLLSLISCTLILLLRSKLEKRILPLFVLIGLSVLLNLRDLWSVLSLSMFIFPIVLYQNLRPKPYISGFYASFYLVLPLLIYESVLDISNLPVPSKILSEYTNIEIRDSHRFNIYRIKGLFSEPAHLGAYLALQTLVFYCKGKSKFWLLLIALFIFKTFSIIGMSLFFVVAGGLLLRRYRGVIVYGSLFIVVMLLLFSDNYFSYRLASAIRSLASNSLTGSEGSRLGSIIIIKDYISSGSFFGEGYGSFETWLKSNYGHFGILSSFYYGKVNNVFAVVLLSFGPVALLAYVYWLLVAYVKRQEWLMLLLAIMLNFSFGMLSGTLFLGLLFLIKFLIVEKGSLADCT